jgi:hypothetical protein
MRILKVSTTDVFKLYDRRNFFIGKSNLLRTSWLIKRAVSFTISSLFLYLIMKTSCVNGVHLLISAGYITKQTKKTFFLFSLNDIQVICSD